MTWTLSDSGTYSTVIGPVSTLANDTNNATFQFSCDLNTMVNGDVFEARVSSITLSAGTLHQTWKGTWANVQINPIKVAPPIASDQQFTVTLKQIGGTFSITSPSSATTLAYGSTITGSVSGAKALLLTPGGGSLSTTATTAVMLMESGNFSTADTAFISGSSSITFGFASGGTAGRSVPWKILRI